tara:strand:+ start:6782 stop:7168 length:387 start_codon:yes stop_codon:yes gene_type:complete
MSEIITDKLTGKATAKTVTVTVGATATQSLETGLVKAFVHFDQTDQIADASLNISSITDQAVGQSFPNFSNSFSSSEFSATAGQTGSSNVDVLISGPNLTSRTFIRMRISGSDTDIQQVSQICCGDLA